jgi:hypothetical protein
MSRIILIVVAALVAAAALLGSQILAAGKVSAQLTPPAGSAGAGMAPINGIPYGPANPRPATDPSGIGNASSGPALRSSNTPTITTPQAPISPARNAALASYPGASQRIINARAIEPKSKRHKRPRSRPQVSSFKGICRGC